MIMCLMLFRKAATLSSKNYMKNTNTICEQSADFSILKWLIYSHIVKLDLRDKIWHENTEDFFFSDVNTEIYKEESSKFNIKWNGENCGKARIKLGFITRPNYNPFSIPSGSLRGMRRLSGCRECRLSNTNTSSLLRTSELVALVCEIFKGQDKIWWKQGHEINY
jgi:hypothetical protein